MTPISVLDKFDELMNDTNEKMMGCPLCDSDDEIPTLQEVVDGFFLNRNGYLYMKRLRMLTYNKDGGINFDFDVIKETDEYVRLMEIRIKQGPVCVKEEK